ncbi:hypothetical protein C2E23DRAFT_802278 [Lenzites betulinus]|nr:hypothetical protein C2E23DRAFT_802267 [Lenzites betulinus]KAH9858002.1 hypothetical protein C2E23DRAFT_802278 [Lenzites betulinus]
MKSRRNACFQTSRIELRMRMPAPYGHQSRVEWGGHKLLASRCSCTRALRTSNTHGMGLGLRRRTWKYSAGLRAQRAWYKTGRRLAVSLRSRMKWLKRRETWTRRLGLGLRVRTPSAQYSARSQSQRTRRRNECRAATFFSVYEMAQGGRGRRLLGLGCVMRCGMPTEWGTRVVRDCRKADNPSGARSMWSCGEGGYLYQRGGEQHAATGSNTRPLEPQRDQRRVRRTRAHSMSARGQSVRELPPAWVCSKSASLLVDTYVEGRR